jgi:NifU-like protein involved in Fe-S cluster formation/bacterioferritin-associated ferredoxin
MPVHTISPGGFRGGFGTLALGMTPVETGRFETATGAAAGRQDNTNTEIASNRIEVSFILDRYDFTRLVQFFHSFKPPHPCQNRGVQIYPPKINARAASPAFAGKAAGANAVGTSASFVCGSFVRFYLRIDRQSLAILDVKYQTNGCGYAVAAAERTVELIRGRALTDLHGLCDSGLEANIFDTYGEFPAERRQCLQLCLDALRSALADFRAMQIEEFTGEKALICTCFGISEESIERAIDENSLFTVAEVSSVTNAGDGCGSCRILIQEIIDSRTEPK